MRYLILLMLLTGLFACSRQTLGRRTSDHLEPYDRFAEQRSWPDPVFDWAGWRQSIQRAGERAAVQERDPGCGGNPTPWTLQGPGNVAGRVNALAVQPGNDLLVLAGFAGGGIFKTVDGGSNWYPVFDNNTVLSIGDIQFDPNNPSVVYAGTGDPNMPSIVFNGNGIYKSIDAGETWTYLGLAAAGIISHILVHPTNPQILYAATMGNPYIRNENRGVYRSVNGGLTWEKVLYISDQAGASDLVMDPTNPDILYASFWDRIRSNFESVVYGPNSKIYKSTNGGTSWTPLGGGLPTGIMGRTGLAISKQNPQKLYAVYVDTIHTVGALYKTIDGGANWTAQNISAIENAFSDFGWYFGKIGLNPTDDEDLYLLGVLLWRRPGNSAWLPGAGGHADSHALIFTPSGRRYWGNDGGVYRSLPGQNSWSKCINLPLTQLYHTDFNPHAPNTYYIGTQDNGVQKGNAAGYNSWTSVFSGDGFNCVFDPANANQFWVENQNGAVHKTSDGGDSWQQGGTALGTSDRVNWDMPFFMSPLNPPKRYAATFRAYEALGDSWVAISNDLTDGVLTQPRFHTVSAMDESPITAGKLFIGTSDANVWRREANGVWTQINNGLPERYVTSVHGSTVDANRIFVTHSGFRDNESFPHIHRSDNNGQSWTDISSDIPSIPVNDLLIMPGQNDQVLFAATDAGVYFTVNAGQNWKRLGSGIPLIPVFDLEINPVLSQLMAATFARGLFTFPLDSVLQQGGTVSVTVSGAINTEIGEGVKDVQVQNQPLTVYSNQAGLFDIEGVPGCQSYTIRPYKNDNQLNGVSTYDLLLMSKHILGIEPLTSPYQLIAADANKSGSITNFDILTIRKLILGLDTFFSANTSWRFVPADFVFPNPQNPFQSPFPEETVLSLEAQSLSAGAFTGIKIGDLNHTVIPNFQDMQDERALDIYPMTVQTLPRGIGYDVQVLSGNVPAVALQFTLLIDPKKWVITHFEPLAPGLKIEHGFIGPGGQFRFSWDRWEGIPMSTPLFQLQVAPLTASAEKPQLMIVEQPTPAQAYTSDAVLYKPFLTPDIQDGNVLCIPNPFSRSGVQLQWPETDALATVQLYDAHGKLFFSRTGMRERIYLPTEIFPGRGLFFYRISTANGRHWAGKMIKSE